MFMLDQMIQEVFLMLRCKAVLIDSSMHSWIMHFTYSYIFLNFRSLNVIAWRMTFLPQFKACVKAGSWSLMCAVNKYIHSIS